MNLSDLFGGGGATSTPAIAATYSSQVTNLLVTASPAILVSAYTYYGGGISVYNGTTLVLTIVAAPDGDDSNPYSLFANAGGIDCPSGIRVTSSANTGLQYILK